MHLGTGESDGLVGELLKYCGSGMVILIVAWQEDAVQGKW